MQNRTRMLFENLQSFLLARDKEIDCIHETSNQKPDLRCMGLYEDHACGQCHAAYHGYGAHTNHLGAGSFRASVVRKGDESSCEFAIQHALPPLLRRSTQFHKVDVASIRVESLLT